METMNSSTVLKPYTTKELKISRATMSHRSQGDGEETDSSKQAKGDLIEIISRDSLPKFNMENSMHFKNHSKDSLMKKKELPTISNIAQRLNKVSLFTVPILSSPPPDFDLKPKILLHPTEEYLRERKSSYAVKKKDPKFIPYEPYKGCVKPIVGPPSQKAKLKEIIAIQTQPKLSDSGNYLNTLDAEKRAINASNEKLNSIISDFQKENTKWELENNCLKKENEDLQHHLTQCQMELSQVQQQLSTQSQVNCELKKLLVASVGEDVQGRVQCLTEDKARMATMIRKYSEKVDKDYEEKEKISIQCDVWRSKFLASSLLIDELARWKVTLFQQYQEGCDALRVLLHERDITHHALVNCYKHLRQIQDAFDPLHTDSQGVGILDACDVLSLGVGLSSVAENLRDRLLGTLGRAVGNTDFRLPDETRTPGEKMAIQVLENYLDPSISMTMCCSSSPAGSLLSRFHPHARMDNVTVNCCGHCSGEIKVV